MADCESTIVCKVCNDDECDLYECDNCAAGVCKDHITEGWCDDCLDYEDFSPVRNAVTSSTR